MEKRDRLALIVQNLDAAPAQASFQDARDLLEQTINAVENEFSGVPFEPLNWMNDGRIYPPYDDQEKISPWPQVRVFRARGHRILIGENGAIKIARADRPLSASDAQVDLDKCGKDGKRCP